MCCCIYSEKLKGEKLVSEETEMCNVCTGVSFISANATLQIDSFTGTKGRSYGLFLS